MYVYFKNASLDDMLLMQCPVLLFLITLPTPQSCYPLPKSKIESFYPFPVHKQPILIYMYIAAQSLYHWGVERQTAWSTRYPFYIRSERERERERAGGRETYSFDPCVGQERSERDICFLSLSLSQTLFFLRLCTRCSFPVARPFLLFRRIAYQ